MNWVKVVGIALQLSIALLVLATGLHASWSDVTYLFRRPAELAKSLLARNVIMPVVALALVAVFDFAPPVRIALLALSMTPIAPILPASQLNAGGREAYVVGLLTSQALLAIAIVPLTVQAFNAVLGMNAFFSAGAVAASVGKLILLPFGLGVTARRLWGFKVEQVARLLQLVGKVLLTVAMLPILYMVWRALPALVGNGTLIALCLFVVIGLAVGHILGGPRHEDRTALALATASRHPGLAIAIVAANAPAMMKLSAATVLLYTIIQAVLPKPYVRRSKRAVSWHAQWRQGLDRRHVRRAVRDRRHAG